MVDLDQCTHATINSCDKERRGWYPLPSSLFPSICLPSCPVCCPLPNCSVLVHLHLHWYLPGGRPPAGAEVLLVARAPDVLSAVSIYCSLRELWAFFLSGLSGDHCFISSSPTLLNLSHFVFLSCTGSGCISHVNLPRLYSFYSSVQWAFCFWPSVLSFNAPFTFPVSTDGPTSSLPNRIWVHIEYFLILLFHLSVSEGSGGVLMGNRQYASQSKWVTDRTVRRNWGRSLTERIYYRNYGWMWARVHADKQI